MFAKLAFAATLLAGLASQALAYNGEATSYAGAGEAINGGGTGRNVSAHTGGRALASMPGACLPAPAPARSWCLLL